MNWEVVEAPGELIGAVAVFPNQFKWRLGKPRLTVCQAWKEHEDWKPQVSG